MQDQCKHPGLPVSLLFVGAHALLCLRSVRLGSKCLSELVEFGVLSPRKELAFGFDLAGEETSTIEHTPATSRRKRTKLQSIARTVKELAVGIYEGKVTARWITTRARLQPSDWQDRQSDDIGQREDDCDSVRRDTSHLSTPATVEVTSDLT